MIKKFLYILSISLFLQMNSANAGSTGSEDLSKSADTTKECFEGVSRAMFKLNHGLDKAIFEPVAKGYRALPAPIRKGTGNVVDNLRSLLTLSNNLLQGDFSRAGNTAARFGINTTAGILGIFDPAAKLGFEDQGKEDFGQTLAVWGVGSGPYLVLPFLGPSSLRDTLGFWADISNMEAFSGIYNIDSRLKTSLNIVNERVKYDVVFKRLQDSDDSYDLFKTLYAQKRKFDIEGEEEIEF